MTLIKLFTAARKNLYQATIMRGGKKSTEQWKIINTFLNNNTSEVTVTELQYSGQAFGQAFDIANELDSSFCSQALSSPVTVEEPIARSSQSFYLFPTGPIEIIDIKNNVTSTGLHEIHSRENKLIAHHIAVPLSRIIN